MAKNWYPVIDILTCAECGTCVRLFYSLDFICFGLHFNKNNIRR